MALDAAGPAEVEPVENLGTRLRQARQRSGLSLRELARQLRVSPSFVSQLENGKSQPSVATLYSLAQLLDVSIDRLFDTSNASEEAAESAPEQRAPAPKRTSRRPATKPEEAAPGEARVSRSTLASPADAWPDQGAPVRLSVTTPGTRARLVMESGVIWEQLARNDDHNVDFMEIIYPPGSSSTNDDRMLRHEGYEYGILLEGELEVTFGFETFTLTSGQGMALDSSVPHLFKNLGTQPARGIWFVHHRH